jgi:hypothetical protein
VAFYYALCRDKDELETQLRSTGASGKSHRLGERSIKIILMTHSNETWQMHIAYFIYALHVNTVFVSLLMKRYQILKVLDSVTFDINEYSLFEAFPSTWSRLLNNILSCPRSWDFLLSIFTFNVLMNSNYLILMQFMTKKS